MKWLLVLVLAVAGVWASEFTFPESARGQSRIVSGWEAEEGQIPFQLSLRMVSSIGQVFGCGASIVHPEWAITAAHCTANRPTLIIRTGTRNLTRPYQIFESTEYYNHPLYNEAIAGVVQPNDIGVIKFPFALEFNRLVQPVRVQRSADMNKNYDGLQLVASGWGALWSSGSSPENLNWVYLRGVTNFFCWTSFGGSNIVQDSTICASGYNDTTQSTCQGDSGGPLTVLEADGKPTLVGVSSFVSRLGCHVDLPAGFARPGHYHDWFAEVTGVNFDWDWSDLTTTEEPTTKEPTTEEPTTKEFTTEEPTTKEFTTEEPTTKVPATEEPTTKEFTTEEPTTKVPATEEPTTKEFTTEEPTTKVPATEEPTTLEPTTQEVTTVEVTEGPTVEPTEEPSSEDDSDEDDSNEEDSSEEDEALF